MEMASSGGKVQNSQSGKLRLDYQNGRLVVLDDDNNFIGLLGLRDDGTIGYDFAPPGTDVRTAGLGDLIASSRFPGFTIAAEGTVTVTRASNNSLGAQNLATGVLGAPMFFCTTKAPAASPTLVFPTPYTVFYTAGADSGKILSNRRALYDPSTGVIRFIVEDTTVNLDHATAETWEFSYFLLYQNIPS
jgi:hypothetical protein